VVFHSLLIISSSRGQSVFGSEVSLSFLFTVVSEFFCVIIVLSLRVEEFRVVIYGVERLFESHVVSQFCSVLSSIVYGSDFSIVKSNGLRDSG
jgi:hypothetical protein